MNLCTCQKVKWSLGNSKLSKHYREPVWEEMAVSQCALCSSHKLYGFRSSKKTLNSSSTVYTELLIEQNALGESLLLPPGEPLQLARDMRKQHGAAAAAAKRNCES